MKLTLFTISNEQIKEQLSKLQTTVESLETVKEVQDKIISTKDGQISFLNDQIANIWTPITIVAGFIALVFGYVAWLNKQAQNKVDQASEIIVQSQNIAMIAQEKINELELKQKELNKLSTSLFENQKMDMLLKNINIELGFIEKGVITLLYAIQEVVQNEKNELDEKYNSFRTRQTWLKKDYIDLSLMFQTKIIKEVVIDQQDEEDIKKLENKCLLLKNEIYDYLENFQENE